MPRWRKSDPATSIAAAQSITANSVTETQKRIMYKLQVPMTDYELVDQFQLDAAEFGEKYVSESGVRSRRAELVSKGLVIDTGIRMKLPSGRFAIMWRVADNFLVGVSRG